MKLIECSRCGSKELISRGDYVVCAYCQSRFNVEVNDRSTVIDIQTDIQLLLVKCIEDPKNRRRYASLILDLDPTNTEAMKYLS